ncbi:MULTISPECIES: hypothetical protein [unclassified Rhizobium]|uniref:hypothetical protein n=1 Tax=unclassified Rhizobium TaxID=2613769 RepID=UPI0038196813
MKDLSKRNREFLRYIDSQREHNGKGRIDIGFIDGSLAPIEPLTRLGYLLREGHDIVITDEGREAVRR